MMFVSDMNNIRVLTLDGGGILGLIDFECLFELERKAQRPLCEVFDLIYGSSTGAIIGAALAAGASVQEIHNLYMTESPKIFTPTHSWWTPWYKITRPWYDREKVLFPLRRLLAKYFTCTLGDLKTRFAATTVNVCTKANATNKSWSPDSMSMRVDEAVSRSFAASVAFGYVRDDVNKTYWGDGGEGTQQCTLRQAYDEVSVLKASGSLPPNARVVIYSFGTGYSDKSIGFKEAGRMNNIKQLLKFHMDYGAGLARDQSIQDQVTGIQWLQRKLGSKALDLRRFDIQIPTKMNKLDAVKYLEDFVEYGKRMTEANRHLLNFY